MVIDVFRWPALDAFWGGNWVGPMSDIGRGTGPVTQCIMGNGHIGTPSLRTD